MSNKENPSELQPEEDGGLTPLQARNLQQKPPSTQSAIQVGIKFADVVLYRIDAVTDYLVKNSVLGQLGSVSRGLTINLLILMGLKILEKRIAKKQPINIESIMMSSEE